MKPSPVVIVLAVGLGLRFQGASHKLARPYGASTVLGTTLAQVGDSGLPMVVVTSEALRELVQGCAPARDVVALPAAPDGEHGALSMGASIAAGVVARGDAPGWLVLPADMPMVQARTLLTVARAMADHPVTCAQHSGLRGHPVAFAGELYSELRNLSGDHDVRRLLARYPVNAIEVDDHGVLLDVSCTEEPPPVRRLPAVPVPPLPMRMRRVAPPPSI